MKEQSQRFGQQVRGVVEQAAARLMACLPQSATPDSWREAATQRVAQQWQRSAPQRAKLSHKLRQGSAMLAEQPIPRVARQGLEHFDALLDRLSPTDELSHLEDDAEQSRHDIACETLVSPLDDAALDHSPSVDNCIAAGTTPARSTARRAAKPPSSTTLASSPDAQASATSATPRRNDSRPRRSRGGRRNGGGTPKP